MPTVKGGVPPGDFWKALPEVLKLPLLVAGVGAGHLRQCAGLALAQAQGGAGPAGKALFRLGLDLLRAAYEASPLDGGLAAQLLDIHGRLSFLDSRTAKALGAACASFAAPPEAVERLRFLHESGDHEALAAFLAQGGRQEPGNVFWRQHGLDLALLRHDWDEALRLAQSLTPDSLGGQAGLVQGDVFLHRGALVQAELAYREAAALFPRQASFRLAEVLRRAGRAAESLSLLRRDMYAAPWRVNSVLLLHDRLRGLDKPTIDLALPGRVVVLLYTYNKARELAATLESLESSALGQARILVLDNGSSDGTETLLQSWSALQPERRSFLRLPSNVGAPAARNWLLRLPEARDSDWIVFLDDDALVPADWLSRLAQAAQAYPEAAAWGCRINDLRAPALIQHADIHLRFPDSAQHDAGFGPELFEVCAEDLDFGQFAYLRPCLSVTGCCHLFRTSTLLSGPGFDVRFSPTQFDDLDRDLVVAASGGYAVYQGHLRVDHDRASGRLARQNRAAQGASLGARLKLKAKHPSERVSDLALADMRRMEADVLEKIAVVDGH